MAARQLGALLRQVRQAALANLANTLTDAQLLECYLERRDDAAFEALVRRHGSMVLGVCRRVLGNSHDAEDAFQATFLVLVRKAASLRSQAGLGSWLHGVACRTALKARTAAARRQARESRMARKEAVLAGQPDDWQAVLDQELQRLPEKYRAAVVLCDLEGKPRKDAARQLGLTESTLGTRLARARRMLLARLTRRGVTLSLAGLSAALAQSSAAALVPATLVQATVQAQRVIALAAAAGAVPAKVALLMEGVLKSMALTKAKKLLAIGLVALTMLGLGTGGYQSLPAGAAAAEDPPPFKPADDIVAVNRDPDLPAGPMPQQALVSMDGGRVAVKMGVVTYGLRKEKAAAGGVERYTYQPLTMVRTHHVDADKVRVFDTRGREIKSPKLRVLLKEQVLGLVVSTDPDPLQLRLIKDGTLVFRLPLPPETPAIEPPPPGHVLTPAPGKPGVVPVPETARPEAKNQDPAGKDEIPEAPASWGDKLFKAVGSTRHDFGTIPRGGTIVHRFHFKNIYKVPLEITSVRVSCGCVTTRQSTTTLKPDETGFIDVSMDTRRFSGNRTARVYVTFGNDYVTTATLTVQAVVCQDKAAESGGAKQEAPGRRRRLPELAGEELNATSTAPINWLTDFRDAVREAHRSKRSILVWCYLPDHLSSQKLAESSWRDDYIRSVLKDQFVCVRIRGDTSPDREFAAKLKVQDWPTILAIDENGLSERIAGYHEPAQVIDFLHRYLRARRSNADVWAKLGVVLTSVDPGIVSAVNPQLRGGLKVTRVRDDSPASRAGIKPGDILVGLHQWEILKLDDVVFTLTHPDATADTQLSVFLVRSGSVRKTWAQLGR
jgi:RNA polymerase sigma factor (sigma-70 family)